MVRRSEYGIQRRVQGHHDFRFDGVSDVLMRVRGCSVLDIGCNRGTVGLECAANGATVVHGCDIDEASINVARSIFADIENCEHKFEVLDLTTGVEGFRKVFPNRSYDVVILFAVYHKLKRIMEAPKLDALVIHFAKLCGEYIVYRGYEEEVPHLDELFQKERFKRVQTSYISQSMITPACIWQRT